MTALEDVAAALRAEGGLLAGALADPAALAAAPQPLADRVEAAPRAAGRPGELAFVLEAVHEAWRLHHAPPGAPPRVVLTEDADLALLAGDRLYALGLARLADRGDLDAVAELADVIALCAQAAAEDCPDLADAAWEAGLAGVGWGPSPALAAAKAAARTGGAQDVAALRSAARRQAREIAH